jgi:hypothetical protein
MQQQHLQSHQHHQALQQQQQQQYRHHPPASQQLQQQLPFDRTALELESYPPFEASTKLPPFLEPDDEPSSSILAPLASDPCDFSCQHQPHSVFDLFM